MTTARLTALSAALAFVGACKDDKPVTQPVTPTVAVASSAATVSATAAAPGTVTITVTRGGNYTGVVNLTAEGVPAGVTASFAPAQLASGVTSSVLTLTPTGTAVAATSTVTIRAAGPSGSGVTDATTTTSLTVGVAGITLTAAATSTSPQGTPIDIPIAITRTGGYAGVVNLTAEGLPTGVTASFAPAQIAAGALTSVLTLTPNGTTSVIGTNNITIRAAGVAGSGVTDKTQVLAFSVTAPVANDYTLSATPATLSVIAGVGGTSTINVARTGTFTGGVTLALTGNPTGVTGTFASNPATGATDVLTIATTAATVPGNYTLTITGTATGITTAHTTTVMLTVTAAPGVTVALAPATVSIAAGGATTSTAVTIARLGGLTGDVVLTAEGLPPGVTLTPLTITGTGTTGTATFTATGATVAGTYPVVLRGTNGTVSGTSTLSLVVTPAAGAIGVVVGPPNTVSVVQGATGVLTANISRLGGFAGTVNLAVTGLPAAVVTTITPAAATGATATISMVVPASVAPGSYTGTITGSTAAGGPANATGTFTLIVTAGAGTNVVFQFCDPARVPVYFGFKDGVSGAWTSVTPTAGNTYTFALTQAVGGVAYAFTAGGTTSTTVLLETVAELNATGTRECVTNPGTGNTVTGTVAGLAAGETATINFGGRTGTATFAAPTYTITNVPAGASDLIAIKAAQNPTTLAFEPNKVIVRRAVTQASGSAIPLLDFNGIEGFTPITANVTLANFGADNTYTSTVLTTANGASSSINTGVALNSTSTRIVYGLPAAKLTVGDLYGISGTATSTTGNVTTFRQAFSIASNLTDRTLTFGAPVAAPTVTVTSGTTLRPRIQGSFQADYGSQVMATFLQANRNVTVIETKGYAGAAATTFDLEVPDLVPGGYAASLGLQPGVATTYLLTESSIPSTAFADGTAYKTASVTGTIPTGAIRAGAIRREE